MADFLEEAVLPDWSGFDVDSQVLKETNQVIQDGIRHIIYELLREERLQTKNVVKTHLRKEVQQLPPISRERWERFVDEVIISCPSIKEADLVQLAGILAKLELSSHKFKLVTQLNELHGHGLDDLTAVLKDWNVSSVKVVLDELKTRLLLVDELDRTLSKQTADEVKEMQPIFKRGLWIFGPEFETIEFTSNKGMTTVIREIFGDKQKGSLHRPDFVIVPDGSVGLYTYPSYDDQGGEIGIARLVIVELKAPDVPIGTEEKNQAWKYVKELYARGLLDDSTTTICWVVGKEVDPTDAGIRSEREGRVQIRPLRYDAVMSRAKSRLLNLYDKVREAPFMTSEEVENFVDATMFGVEV